MCAIVLQTKNGDLDVSGNIVASSVSVSSSIGCDFAFFKHIRINYLYVFQIDLVVCYVCLCCITGDKPWSDCICNDLFYFF